MAGTAIFCVALVHFEPLREGRIRNCERVIARDPSADPGNEDAAYNYEFVLRLRGSWRS